VYGLTEDNSHRRDQTRCICIAPHLKCTLGQDTAHKMFSFKQAHDSKTVYPSVSKRMLSNSI